VLERRDAADGAPLAYRVATAEGSLVEIPASEVEGSGIGGSGKPLYFSLLPGLGTLFRRLDLRYLGFAFAAFGPPLFLMAVRWRLLLVASGVSVPFWILVRLHYLAFFFNTFMPGGAGGDIIKAVYVTRHSSQKAEAATMVLIDRVVGMIGLLVMAGGVVIFNYDELRNVALQIGVISFALVALGVLFFSASFRKLVRYEAVIERLPKSEALKKVDRALLALRKKKGDLAAALALTIALQFLEVVGVWFAGRSLGLHKATFVHYVAFVPIGYLVNALPISFGGIGLMEGAYLKLFRDAGVATATQGFMLGVLARLIVVGWSLAGALSALFPPERAETLAEETGGAGS
jgi:glycosyltransferase 2 family protein